MGWVPLPLVRTLNLLQPHGCDVDGSSPLWVCEARRLVATAGSGTDVLLTLSFLEEPMLIHSVEPRRRALAVYWSDRTCSDFPYQFLRDNCPSGFHSITQERMFDLLSVPEDLAPSEVRVDDQTLIIDWPGKPGHQTRLSGQWLEEHRPGQRYFDPADVPAVSWGSEFSGEMAPTECGALSSSSDLLREWLVETKRRGLSIISGLDDRETAGIEFGERIGFLRRTNFGDTFRVETKPDPNNLAYTSHALTLHTDLPNQEVPPGFQFLHCLRNEATGGISTFADGFRIAERIREDDPQAFSLLSTIPIPYRFHDREHDIRVHRPLIGLDERGQLSDVRFSAHLMSAFDMASDVMEDYYRAFRVFMTATRDPSNIVALKLNGGEMAVFDNRRVLHGRTAFDPSTGHRLLCGFYIDRGEFDSCIRMMEHRKT